jgi:polysaccharide transporter, PST family
LSTPELDPHLRVDQLSGDIRRRSLRGGAIAFGAQGLKFVAQFGAVIAMTRLLPPAAFGLIAMVAALNTVLDLIKEFGLSAATIQKPDITHRQVTALFWINTAIGAGIALALYLVAPGVAEFYGQPELLGVTRWLGIGFALSGLTTQHWALLRRQMRFGSVAVLETGAEFLAFAVGIGLAVAGAGYWALVAQRLVGPVVIAIGCWSLCGWRPGWPARTAGLGELMGFGLAVTGCNLSVAFARSIDQILIGWLWGPSVLGLYERSVKLLLMPVTNISIPLYAVGMPTLSRLDDQPERYRTAVNRLVENLAMVTVPAGALIAMVPDWLVATLFGPEWQAAAPLVALFGIAVAYQPVVTSLGLVYLTQNRPRDLLHFAVIDSCLASALIVTGLPFGVVGVAACYAFGGLVLRTPFAVWFATRNGRVRSRELYAAVVPSCIAGLAVAAAVWSLRQMPWLDGLVPAERLALAPLAALLAVVVIYAALPRSRRALAILGSIPRFLYETKPATQA